RFVTLPPGGSATICASYTGDGNFQGSGATGSLTITQAATATTIGTIAASCGMTTITVPVSIANTSNAAALTGGTVSVAIKQGSNTFGTASVAIGGASPVTVSVAVPVG